jgi:putative integral membrane protein (TIGR02587 family)
MAIATKKHRKSAWGNELNDLIRGCCGGFLLGIPLLYTMEVWWIGSFVEPPMMIVAIAAVFVGVFGLNRTSGFRKTNGNKASDAFIDTIEALAIGFICATLVLILLQEITPQVPLDEAIGKAIFESIPFSLGVALASHFLSGSRDTAPEQKSGGSQSGKMDQEEVINATLADIGATLIGAAIIASNIAPTDEVSMLAAATSPPWLLAIVAASLLISYGIVFEAGFADQQRRLEHQGIFQQPLSETMMAYLVSLIAAAFMLWFFQQLSFDDPWSMWLCYTLILGLPATIGGAAGRLAI